MRTYLLILLTALTVVSPSQVSSAQEKLPYIKCGLTADSTLNACEVRHFNQDFEQEAVDFTGKTLAFVYGPNGAYVHNKRNYFRRYTNAETGYVPVGGQLLALSADEKATYGYDYLLVTESRTKITTRRKAKILKKIAHLHSMPTLEHVHHLPFSQEDYAHLF